MVAEIEAEVGEDQAEAVVVLGEVGEGSQIRESMVKEAAMLVTRRIQ